MQKLIESVNIDDRNLCWGDHVNDLSGGDCLAPEDGVCDPVLYVCEAVLHIIAVFSNQGNLDRRVRGRISLSGQ